MSISKRSLCTFLLLLFISNSSYSQYIIQGTILDGQGKPIPEASVTTKGKKGSTISDKDGIFILKIKDNKKATVFVSSPDYKKIKTNVSGNSILDIIMVSKDQDEEGHVVFLKGNGPNGQSADVIVEQGDNYLSGLNGYPQNYNKAFILIKKAALQNYPFAQAYLGLMYYRGYGVKPDLSEAMNWLEKAAAQEEPYAFIGLGLIYLEGISVGHDYAEAMKWFKLAAEKGDPYAYIFIGKMYRDGNGVEQDYTEALKWFKLAAEKKEPYAYVCIGEMYRDSNIGDGDYTEAMEWFKKGADQKHPDALFDIGVMYSNGLGVEKNYTEALKWYELSAKEGNYLAFRRLGDVYFKGEGVDIDYSEALNNYLKAADNNFLKAQYNLGVIYENGYGVDKNYDEAIKWYKQAANQGLAVAQYNLGVYYENIEKNYIEAVKWYRKAANNNYASAQNNLGTLYQEGLGVDKNEMEAFTWYTKAAEKGNVNAQHNLGNMYYEGSVVEKDLIKALEWYSKAASSGLFQIPFDNKTSQPIIDYSILARDQANTQLSFYSFNSEENVHNNNHYTLFDVNPSTTIIDEYPKRLALVIGNSDYPLAPLKNPTNDAQDVALKLEELGFDVILRINLDHREMDETLISFCHKSSEYDAALFYYSGHAFQEDDGINYLIPAKQAINQDNPKYDCVNMRQYIEILNGTTIKYKIIILDACRDNKLTSTIRTFKTGLSSMSDRDCFILFSTQAGRTAADGISHRNSPFTESFLNELDTPNITLSNMAKRMQSKVSEKTNKTQIPAIFDNIVGDFYFNIK